MELYLAYFPALRLAVIVIIMLIVGFLFYKKWYKTSVAVGLVAVVFSILAPLKYDGTNTVERSKATQKMRTAEYSDVSNTVEVVHTKEPTFAERMAEEDARSAAANQKVTDEIVK